MSDEKVGFLNLLKRSVWILFKKPNFTVFTIIASLPLFPFLIMFETLLQQSLTHVGKSIHDTSETYHGFDSEKAIERLIGEVSLSFLLLVVVYLAIIYLLDIFNTIAVVDVASVIYTDEKDISLRDMLFRLVKETRVKGPLITSTYVLLLDSLVLLGLVSVSPYIYLASSASSSSAFLSVPFSAVFIALLAKYMEWSAIWNMGILISVVEDKQGDVPLVISSYLSRDSRSVGLVLMLAFFVCKLALRLSCLHLRWTIGGSGVVVVATQVGAICLTNVIKWIIFVLYFHDCKERSSKKKIDIEEANVLQH